MNSRKSLENEPVGSKRILVIDDEAVIREVVQSCLEDLAGWNVITASSGWEGLTKEMKEKPDAIILDVMMPEMDGLKFIQLLRANPQAQSIPVVLLTVREEFTNPQWVASSGLAGALAKPFEPYELVEQIAKFLGWKVGN